jgi:hypothetical protein
MNKQILFLCRVGGIVALALLVTLYPSMALNRKVEKQRKEALKLESQKRYVEADAIYTANLAEERDIITQMDVLRILMLQNKLAEGEKLCKDFIKDTTNFSLELDEYLGSVQIKQQKYAIAAKTFATYISKGGTSETVKKQIKLLTAPPKYLVRNEKILNSEYNDYAPTMAKNIVIFSSNRPYRDNKGAQKSSTINQFNTYFDDYPPNYLKSYYDKLNASSISPAMQEQAKHAYSLDMAKVDSRSEEYGYNNIMNLFSESTNMFVSTYNNFAVWGTPEITPQQLNLYGNNTAPYFTGNGNTLYFNSLVEDGEMVLKVTTKYNNEWIYPMTITIPILSKKATYCLSHCISHDGKIIIIAANKEKGEKEAYGGFDLYMCTQAITGHWGRPVNLGNIINTSSDEMYPYFDANDNLYFASNGHTGLGGMDIFQAIGPLGHWDSIVNLGHPVNSPDDDYSIMFYPNSMTSGLFSSNRKGGLGGYDIYSFDQIQGDVSSKNCTVAVKIIDRKGKPIDDATVLLTNKQSNKNNKAKVSIRGEAFFSVKPKSKYTILVFMDDGTFIPTLKKEIATKAAGSMDNITVMMQNTVSSKKKKK